MLRLGIFLLVVVSICLVSGCSGSSGNSQSTFYHNNREHRRWVNNPSHKPSYRNPNTGHKLFY